MVQSFLLENCILY